MISGRTYTLNETEGESTSYYRLVRELTDRLVERSHGVTDLRDRIRAASKWRGIPGVASRRKGQMRMVLQDLDRVLTPYLTEVEEHIRSLSLADRFDRTMRTNRDQYLLYMLEIELTNRINRKGFSGSPWRMALIAHCLKDFRKNCRAISEGLEEQCAHCDPGCYVNSGSELFKRYGIHPFISVSMDHRKLFKTLKARHPGMAVVGIACIPELVMGMRLCEGMAIPAVGVPLDANRCSRWLGECLETTYSLEELERLVKPVPGTKYRVQST